MDNKQDLFTEQEALLALSLVPNFGGTRIKQLLDHFGSAKNVFLANEKQLTTVNGIGTLMAERLHKEASVVLAKEKLKKCYEKDIKALIYNNATYPPPLMRIPDAPMVLFQKGSFEFKERRIVGIVGTRKITNYGKWIIKEVVSQLSHYNVATVSGLAYGVDIMVHRESIKHHIPSIGVIAGGHDHIYPQQHTRDAESMIQEGGAIITEYMYDVRPVFSQFPARNRIIAGLSDVLIVVEAAQRGGALITAEIADGYEIPVYAIPGGLDREYSKGCNMLINRLKARVFISVQLMMQNLGWIEKKQQIVRQEQLNLAKNNCSVEENIIIDYLDKSDGVLHIDQLKWMIREKYKSKKFELSMHLLELEFKNIIVVLPGQKIQLSKKIEGLK